MESTTALDPTGTTKTHNVEILTDEMKKSVVGSYRSRLALSDAM